VLRTKPRTAYPSTFVSHNFGLVRSPHFARNVGHRFKKKAYQAFFFCSPYLFGARDIISADYAYSTNLAYHLLASQYTANGGMHQIAR
jgi:hypothetical protein